MLQLSLSFAVLPGALGAILLDSTFNASLSDNLDKPPDVTVCVNNTKHPTWGPTLDEFDFNTCQNAVGLIASKLEGKVYNSYDFYSRQVYPSGPGAAGYETWPLAQGAGVG